MEEELLWSFSLLVLATVTSMWWIYDFDFDSYNPENLAPVGSDYILYEKLLNGLIIGQFLYHAFS